MLVAAAVRLPLQIICKRRQTWLTTSRKVVNVYCYKESKLDNRLSND